MSSRFSCRPKLGQRHVIGHVVEHNFHRHTDADVSIVHRYQVGEQPRAFFQFHFSHIVGNIVFKGRKICLVKHYPGIHFSAAAQFLPGNVA